MATRKRSADIQVPQVEDLLAQEPDALILVPMGAAALSAPVERAMMQGVPVVLCASAVETDNFVTEVGTNLYSIGATLAQWLIDTVGADGDFLMMTGIPGTSTSDIMEEGALAVFDSHGIELMDKQPGDSGRWPKAKRSWKLGWRSTATRLMAFGRAARKWSRA